MPQRLHIVWPSALPRLTPPFITAAGWRGERRSLSLTRGQEQAPAVAGALRPGHQAPQRSQGGCAVLCCAVHAVRGAEEGRQGVAGARSGGREAASNAGGCEQSCVHALPDMCLLPLSFKLQEMKVEAILRSGIRRFTDEARVGGSTGCCVQVVRAAVTRCMACSTPGLRQGATPPATPPACSSAQPPLSAAGGPPLDVPRGLLHPARHV